jgi:GNAT superfamily N-acetyltransferase
MPVSTPTFTRHDAAEARALRSTVEDIYRRSYTVAIESGDLFDTPEEFMARFDAYTHPDRSSGFDLIIAHIDGEPAGQTWGWPLGPGAAWWRNYIPDVPDPDFMTETGERTFALSEVMVCQEYAGTGLAHALHDELLGGRREQRATLLVEVDNTRAYTAYRKWGWRKVGVLRPSWPEAPRMDVLIHELPV